MEEKEKKLHKVTFKINIPKGDAEKAISAFDMESLYNIVKGKINIETHCAQGYCGFCKFPKPEIGIIKYANNETPIANINTDENGNDTEVLGCVGRIDVESMLKEKGISHGIIELTFKVPESMLVNKPTASFKSIQDKNENLRRPKP